jgi:pimeloyl-ACP methyl ester carboxylesterase
MSADFPTWFSHAICDEPRSHQLHVGSTQLQLWHWGEPTLPALILMHGGFAHSGWYRHIAPFLSTHYHVIAFDFSGHGDSDWRDCYALEDFLDEIAAVMHWRNTPCTLIGHSLGAKMAYWYACQNPHLIDQLVLLDPPMLIQHPDFPPTPKTKRKPKHYSQNLQSLLQRFRIIPPQPILHPWLGQFIAEKSVVHETQGYRWKADLNMLSRIIQRAPVTIPALDAQFDCSIVYGEHSLICTKSTIDHAVTTHPHLSTICLHDAYHALMLDQPQALTLILQRLLQHHPQS